MSLINKIKGFFEKSNTLYYPGCVTRFVYKDILNNYRELLKKSKIDYIELKDAEKCCGSPVINAGYKKDYEDLIVHNRKIFDETGIKKIITNCPACYKVLKESYPEITVEHAAVTLLKSIIDKRLEIKKRLDAKITYHDPCHLGRHSGIYDEPRQILNLIGFEILEMEHNRENSLCCGAGAGLQNNNKEISEKVTKIRLNQADKTGAKMIITACPMCYHQLKKHSKKMKVAEISEVLLNATK